MNLMFPFRIDENEVAKRGVLNGLGAFIYVAAVVGLMSGLQRFADRPDPAFLAPLAMLMLFVLSAAVMALLVFGKPAMLYVDGRKKEAVQMVGWTVGSLAVATLVVFLIMTMTLRY